MGHAVIRCPVHGRRIDLADGRCVDSDLAGDFCVVTSQGDASLSQDNPALPPHRVHPVFVDSDGTLRVLIQASGPPRASDRYNTTAGGRAGGGGGDGPAAPQRPAGAAGVGLGGFPVSPRRAAGLASGVARGAPRPMAYDDEDSVGPSSSGDGGRSTSTSGEGGPAGPPLASLAPSHGPLTPFAGPQADKWAATSTALGAGGGGGGGLPAVFRGRKRAAAGVAAAPAPAKAPAAAPAAAHHPSSPVGITAAFAARGAAARRAVLERSLGGVRVFAPPVGGGGGPTQRTLDAFFGGSGSGGASGGGGGGGIVAMDE